MNHPQMSELELEVAENCDNGLCEDPPATNRLLMKVRIKYMLELLMNEMFRNRRSYNL